MNKDILRNKYKNIRKNIKEKDLKSEKIFNIFLKNIDLNNINVIGVYSSLLEEVNTKYFIEYFLSQNKEVCYPKIITDKDMVFIKSKDVILKNTNKYSINEPEFIKANIVDKSNIDLIIIPLIAFDKYLNRIGYGKGYYDNYLSSFKGLKIGVDFDCCYIKNTKIDALNSDIKLDLIITENGIYK